MSLVSWYPLIKDFKDNGIAGADLTYRNSSTTITWTDGKLGKAATFSGNSATLQRPLFTQNNNFSACCWFCITDTSTTRQHIFSNGRDVANDGWGVDVYSNLKTRWECGSAVLEASNSLSPSVELNKWYHAAIICENSVAKFYLNGEQIYSATVSTLPLYVQGGNFCNLGMTSYMGTSYSYPLKGKINDFRIYDHPLSEREVKELASGLCLHYALKGTGVNPNLAQNSATMGASSGNNGNFTHETVYYDGQPVRRFTCTATSYGPWGNPFDTGKGAIVGTVYTWSAMLRASRNVSKTIGHEAGGRRSFALTTEWQYITYTWTYAQSNYNAFTIYDNWAVGDWVEIKNLKIEEGNVATPYIPHINESTYSVLNSTTEYNLTGLGNNCTYLGTQSYVDESPRYNNCIYFNGDTSGVTFTDTNFYKTIGQPHTIAFWIKPDGENGARSVYFGSNGNVLYTISIEKNASNQLRYYWNNGSPDYSNTAFTIADNEWTHIAIVRESETSTKFYKNGNLINTYTTKCATPTSGTNQYYIGRDQRTGATAYKGYMSDFRFYTTPLSADSIKELYNLPMSIDNNSNLLSREINEIGKSGITKNYGAKTTEIIENTGKSAYTLTGSPTITNGIASNFSASNCINPTLTMADTSTLEFYFFDVTPATTRITANWEVIFGSSNANKFKIGFHKTNMKWAFWNGSSWVASTMDVVIGKTYDLKLTWDGSTYIFYGKLNTDKEYTKLVTVSSTDKILYSNLFIGRNASNTPEFFSGTLNLNKVFFKENGIIVWRGVEAVLGSTKAKIGTDYISANQMEEF